MQKLVLVLFLLYTNSSSWGQDIKKSDEQVTRSSESGKGKLKGKIIDFLKNTPLPGAYIKVLGTNVSAASNLSGEFVLYVPEGKYQIEISYVGYDSQIQEIELVNNKVVTIEVKMITGIFELADFTIERLQGQASALNQQKTADNIKNIVASDQIGRFPDPNVAEALQRVPGVNITRTRGEGRYVLIRGLAPEYTNIAINGEQVPSPEAGVRYIALDAIPADQIASMEVVKTITPDMDGDAIGGSVNLITKKAESTTLSVSGTLVGEYNNLMKKGGYAGAVSVGQRIANSKFGYMLNASYYASQRGTDALNFGTWTTPSTLASLELRDYAIERNRLGLSSTFDYRFNENSQIYVRTLYGELNEHEYRRRMAFKYDEKKNVWEASRNTKDRPEIQGVNSFNVGGIHTGYKFHIDYEAAYSIAKQNTPYSREVSFKAKDLNMSLDVTDPLEPIISPITTKKGDSFDYLDNSNYVFNEFKESSTLAKDQNITGKLNIKIPFDLTSASGFIKFGGKARFKERSYNYEDENGIYELANKNDVPAVAGVNLVLSDFDGGRVDNNFMKGKYQVGSFPDVNTFRSYFNQNREFFVNDQADANTDRVTEEYTASEDVYAGYVMGRIQFSKLMVVAGMRYESTLANYKYGIWDVENENAVPVDQSNTYHFFLPMLHLKYSLTNHTNVRGSVTSTYARPNIQELTQLSSFELGAREATLANPALKPVSGLNFDLFGEHYLGNIGILSAGAFYKKLDNFIFRQNNVISYRGVDSVTVIQAVNGGKASLFGLELSWQQNFTFLPGVLKGLGIYTNYTFTASEAVLKNSYETAEEKTKIDLPGQAAHVGNFALSYIRKGFNCRIIANFNGKFIDKIQKGSHYTVNDRMQLDFSASQTITPKIGAFVELINLTNQREVNYANSLNTPVTREYYGFWGRFGMKFNL